MPYLGEKLPAYYDQEEHHRRMRELKEKIHGPCPVGHQLSLINPDSPDVYWGRGRNGQPYLLSTDPADYEWESSWENTHRRRVIAENDLPEEDDYSEDSMP